jgi:hypothetical protein
MDQVLKMYKVRDLTDGMYEGVNWVADERRDGRKRNTALMEQILLCDSFNGGVIDIFEQRLAPPGGDGSINTSVRKAPQSIPKRTIKSSIS